MPQKTLKKKASNNKVKPHIRKGQPEKKKNLKSLHLNAIKKGKEKILKIVNKTMEETVLEKAKIGE